MNRLALVIGNSDYQYVKKLNNPTNDANDMAKILERLDFKVIKILNASLIEIQESVNSFLFELDDNATGLFYYAGHGMQIDGENYIVPIDCTLSDKAKTFISCFSLNEYLNKLSIYKGKTNICILDACRNNPFANGRGDFSGGFTKFHNQPKGTIIAYSTSPDSTASDGVGSNGLYTQVLKDVIQIPNLKIEDIFKSVRSKVSELSNDTQISWEHSSLVGDFYFSVTQQPVDSKYNDEEIFTFINDRSNYYGATTEDIYDIECLPYIDAYKEFNIPIIKILRAFSRIQYKKEGKNFSDATIDQINISYLNSWGFYQSDNRWYYKNSYVEMGDPLPLPAELAQPTPISEQELKIGGNAKGVFKDGKIQFTFYSNIPENTPLIFTLKKGKYIAQSKVIAKKNRTISEWFSKRGKTFWNGHYRLEITAPTYNVLPNDIKLLFGERNRNLTGKHVKFDPICGNIIYFVLDFLIKDEQIIFFDK